MAGDLERVIRKTSAAPLSFASEVHIQLNLMVRM
jgi:hypothetical protein